MNNRTQNGVSYVQGFDKENRLISVTTNGQTTQFKYDANGQRTMTLAPNGLYTFYPFPNVEEEVNLNNGDYTLKYTYNTAGAAVGVRTKAKQGATTTNTLHYLYADHLGSTSVVTNSSGGQVQQTRFLPFGGYWGTPTQTVTDRGYTGHLHNDEVGLIYMNARFYVPGIGRFASADTIVPSPTNPQAFNRYSYVKNNPLNRVDPTGHVDCGLLGDESDSAGCEEAKPKPIYAAQHQGEDTTTRPGKELSDEDLYILTLAVFAETQNGKHPKEFLILKAWTYLNKVSLYPGKSVYSTMVEGTTTTFVDVLVRYFEIHVLDIIKHPENAYPKTESEQIAWLMNNIVNRYNQGSDKISTDFQQLYSLIKNEIYPQWLAYGTNSSADPTHGAIFAVDRSATVLDEVIISLETHAQNNPNFSYVVTYSSYPYIAENIISIAGNGIFITSLPDNRPK